jgi:hypothetical protein
MLAMFFSGTHLGGFWNDVLRSCEISVEMTGSSHCLSFTGV